jgi:hypothetical protein
MRRISGTANGVRDQITKAVTGVANAGAAWPAEAPTLAEITAVRDDLAAAIADTSQKQAAWKTAAGEKRRHMRTAVEMLKIIDRYTDALYSANSAAKLQFGLDPKGREMPPLEKLDRILLIDGPEPGALRMDWNAIKNAVYEIQWSGSDDFASLAGSGVSTSSAFVIFGLDAGTQYWVRVRPVRGGQIASWSMPRTRIAPV